MGVKLDTYFGTADIEQIIGDQLNASFSLSIDGTNFSFTDYTVTSLIVDKFGNTVTTPTCTKSTTTVTDDTITITAPPADLPTSADVYGWHIKYTSDLDANVVRTFVRGKIIFKPETDF